MANFRCLGSTCEDTCCQGWTIALDEPSYRRLTLLAVERPAAARLLSQGVELTPQGPHSVQLRFSESGRCGMLDESGLCAIHGELGHDFLPEVCASYPRYYNEVDGQLELFGTLSCPEVARQCLLGDDVFDIQNIQLDGRPRKLRNRFTTEAPYFKPYLLVRKLLLELLRRADYTLSEKLFALLWCCSKVGKVVQVRALELPPLQVETTLAGMLGDAVLADIIDNYRALKLDGALAFSVVSAVVSDNDAAHNGMTWSEHLNLRERSAGPALERGEALVARYCQNYLLTTPYMLFENLFAYARNLIRCAAVLRVLIQRRLVGFNGDKDELDACLVEVVYRFCRRFEHSDTFHKLDQSLEQQGLNSLAHSVGFLVV